MINLNLIFLLQFFNTDTEEVTNKKPWSELGGTRGQLEDFTKFGATLRR